jgi:hypothetical protein
LPWVFREFLKKKVYLKHFGSIEYALIDDYTFKCVESYKAKGALSKKDLLDKKIKENLWSEEQDKTLLSLSNNIQLMLSKRSKAMFDEQLDEIDNIIKDYRVSYNSLLSKKENLLILSAETLSNGPITEYILYLSFYKEEKLENKLFDIEDVIDFSDKELFEAVDSYRNCIDSFSTSNIRKLSALKNVRDYIKHSSNAESYFNKSGYLLTQNQLTLFEYSKYFISLLEKIEDITDEESNNADEIERIFITEMNNKNNNTKKADPSTLKNAAESFKNS